MITASSDSKNAITRPTSIGFIFRPSCAAAIPSKISPAGWSMTGSSHFAWSLDKGPKQLLYYGSSRGLIHTLPFYLLQGKGKMSTYWLDCEGSTWQ